MTEYQRGFSDGFAAAVRQGEGVRRGQDDQPTIAEGFYVSENTRRIAVTLPNSLFNTLVDLANQNRRSMSAEIRTMFERANAGRER